jgi:hypothetical protein
MLILFVYSPPCHLCQGCQERVGYVPLIDTLYVVVFSTYGDKPIGAGRRGQDEDSDNSNTCVAGSSTYSLRSSTVEDV